MMSKRKGAASVAGLEVPEKIGPCPKSPSRGATEAAPEKRTSKVTFPWKLGTWTYLDYTVGGLFVHISSNTLTANYWLVPGTGY